MKFLYGKTISELKELCLQLGLPKFTASQIADWLYKKRVSNIDEMTNISLENRKKLSAEYVVGVAAPKSHQTSKDGTKKYIFETFASPKNDDKTCIESVYIPDDDRATLCVSSQAGCRMACKFCMTGRMGFVSNISAGEILNQIRSIDESETLTNIVYMGMGEPFDNIDEVLKSLEIITSDYGFAWSPKRVTVSTIGVIPSMIRFLDESKCHLAVSLHNPFGDERLQLMPVQNKYPISEVVNVLKRYDFSHQRRVSFEYTMFAGMNDTPRHAQELVKLLNGVECRVNLIRFHQIPDSDLRPSDDKTIAVFQKYLNSKNIVTTLRASRGLDILAACGMLANREKL